MNQIFSSHNWWTDYQQKLSKVSCRGFWFTVSVIIYEFNFLILDVCALSSTTGAASSHTRVSPCFVMSMMFMSNCPCICSVPHWKCGCEQQGHRVRMAQVIISKKFQFQSVATRFELPNSTQITACRWARLACIFVAFSDGGKRSDINIGPRLVLQNAA